MAIEKVSLDPEAAEYLLERWDSLTPAQQKEFTKMMALLKTDPGEGMGPPLSISTRFHECDLGLGMSVCIYYEAKGYPSPTEILVRTIVITLKKRPTSP